MSNKLLGVPAESQLPAVFTRAFRCLQHPGDGLPELSLHLGAQPGSSLRPEAGLRLVSGVIVSVWGWLVR